MDGNKRVAHAALETFVVLNAPEVTWEQAFEDPAVAARLRHVAKPANEENLDRLAAVFATTGP